jgi:hypothetical protein
MDLVIWTYIFGGATIFGFIVGVFSVWNGRMTRREIRQVIEAGDRRTQDLIERLTVHMQEMDRRHTELLTEVLRRVS